MERVKKQFSRIWFHTKSISAKIMSKIFRGSSVVVGTAGDILGGVTAGVLFLIFTTGLVLMTIAVGIDQYEWGPGPERTKPFSGENSTPTESVNPSDETVN